MSGNILSNIGGAMYSGIQGVKNFIEAPAYSGLSDSNSENLKDNFNNNLKSIKNFLTAPMIPGQLDALGNKIIPPKTSVSTTTVSNANKSAAVPAIKSKTEDLSKTGLTTDANGVTHNADGSIYTPPVDNSALIKSTQEQLTQAQAALKNAQSQGATADTQIDEKGNIINAPAPVQTTYTNYLGENVPATGTVPAGSIPDGKGGYTTPDGKSVNADDGTFETKQIQDNLNQQKAQNDATTAAVISSIQESYSNIINQQSNINNTAVRSLTNFLASTGLAMGAPTMAAGEIQSVMSYGLSQISDLNAKEQAAITAARQAGDKEDFQLMDKMNTLAEKIRDEKVGTAQKLADSVATAKTEAANQAAILGVISPTTGTGTSDPAKILKQLQKSGNTTITLNDINKTLNSLSSNGIDTSKLPTDVQTFNWLASQPNGLPASILALPDKASQLAAYLKMINSSSASVINANIKASGGAGTGAINVAQSAGISDTTVPLQQAIDTVGMDAIVRGILANEGGSLPGVMNNPGNIKYVGLPGQVDSKVAASDGGTFASYDTIDDGKKAIADLVKNGAAKGQSFEDFINKYTNTAPAVLTQADYDAAKQVLAGNETMAQVPAANRANVNRILAGSGAQQYSPIAASRLTTAATKITAPFTKLPVYEQTAGGAMYLARIDAASKNPGSVSDQDLLDSLTKLNTAGNAITDAQVRLITDGKSFSDAVNAYMNKFNTGGVLSNDQRQQIQSIAKAIYANYQKLYEPVYTQATQQLTAAGIPKAFWTIPDLNNLSKSVSESVPGNTKQAQSSIGQKIQQAQQSNYSSTEILDELSKDSTYTDSIAKARAAKWSDDEIAQYLSNQQ